MFSHLWILKDTRDVTPFQTETSADKDLSVARQSAKQKNIIIVIKKKHLQSVSKLSLQRQYKSNAAFLLCCVLFSFLLFCLFFNHCIRLYFDESVGFLFYCLITIVKFNNKLVTINFESSKYKKDFHLSPPNILLVSHVNSSRKL